MKPKCRLSGEDGNVFNIIALVSKALEKAGQDERAREFRGRAIHSQSYDEVLSLCHNYVEIS